MASIAEMFVKIRGDNSELNKSIDNSKKKLQDFSKTAGKVGGDLTKKMTLPLAALATGFVVAADKQEKAEAALTNAIRATGKEAEISLDSLKEYTAGLQSVTTFGDEAQLSALALVQQLSDLNEDGLKAVLPGILDFSAAMGVDLQTAASLVGKTLGSSTNALARYGVELDPLLDPTEKLAALTDQLSEKFDGAAESAAAAGLGPVVQLKNSIGDLAESFGSILIPEVNKVVAVVGDITQWFSDLDDTQKKLILSIGGVAAAVGPLLLVFSKLTSVIGNTNPYVLAATAIIALGTVIFNLTKNMRQEAQERKDLQQKQADGIDLTTLEAIRLAELNIQRQKALKLKYEQNIATAESLNLGDAAIARLEKNIRVIDSEIAQGQLRIRSLYENQRAQDLSREADEAATLELADHTEAVIIDTEKTEENKEAVDLWGESVETAYAGYGEAARVTVAQVVEAEKRAHEDKMDRIADENEAIKKQQEDALKAAGLLYDGLNGVTSSYFDYKLSLYDKDSAKYKEVQKQQFEVNKATSAINAGIAGAQAAIEAYKALAGIPVVGPGLGAAAALAIAGFTAAQVSFILAQKPPAFAEGGIVNPTPGGTIAQVAEAGQPEVIFPLDKLDDFLSGDSAGGGGGDIYLTVEMDSQPILEKIFPATRNRQILIDARAVV